MRVIVVLTAMLAAFVYSPHIVAKDKLESRAQVIFKASGLKGKIKDQVISDPAFLDTTTGHLTEAALTTLTAPSVGLDMGWGLGIGLLNMAFKPDPDLSRSSVFFWAPREKKQKEVEVREAYTKMFNDILIDELTHLGINTHEVMHINDGSFVKAYRSIRMTYFSEDTLCEGESNCIAGLKLYQLKKKRWSKNLGMPKGKYWFANPSKTSLPPKTVIADNYGDKYRGFNELELMRRISARMPDYFYMFYIPESLWLNAETKNKVPLIIEKGKVEYFVVPSFVASE